MLHWHRSLSIKRWEAPQNRSGSSAGNTTAVGLQWYQLSVLSPALCSIKSKTEVTMPWELCTKCFGPQCLLFSYPFYLKISFTSKNIHIFTLYGLTIWGQIYHPITFTTYSIYTCAQELAESSTLPQGQIAGGGAGRTGHTFTSCSKGCAEMARYGSPGLPCSHHWRGWPLSTTFSRMLPCIQWRILTELRTW